MKTSVLLFAVWLGERESKIGPVIRSCALS